MYYSYAHSLPGATDRNLWEPIYTYEGDGSSTIGHANRTAELCARFAEIMTFGMNGEWRKWGWQLGLWHDLGKFSREFQKHIGATGDSEEEHAATGGRVDHSSAGAKYAMERNPVLGDFMAYAIAGHHGGLPKGTALFYERLKGDHPEWRSFAHPDLLKNDPVKKLWNGDALALLNEPRRFGYATSMQIRMMFSCLVDADFLSTEAFMNPAQQAERPRWPGDILDRMSCMLESRLSALEEGAAPGKISSLRAEIHRSCFDHAARKPGVYRLNVPTGGGKTLSSLSFALRHAVQHGLHRVIYVIPYTSIIEQTAQEFRKVFAELSEELGHDCVLEHHSNIEADRDTVMTKLMSENWDAPLIVTTNVQFFESLFAHKPSACRKLHRIARSAVIFDEAQALPSNLLAPCLEAMKTLRRDYGCTLVLCTATQPALMYREDKFPIGWQEAEVESLLGDEQEAMLAREMKRVEIAHLGARSREEIVEHFLGLGVGSALLIVNTTRQAQELFAALRASLPDGTACRHLSARMCPQHRSEVLREVRSLLKEGLPVVLVATRVVEAGVDISFPAVYREHAGIDSLAQAAGRCNRHGELPGGGLVFSYEASDAALPSVLSDLLAAANAARDVRDTNPGADMLAPDIVRRFFELYYKTRGDQTGHWDEHGVLDLSRCTAEETGFRHIDFPEIARKFQLIPGGQHSVMIPRREKGQRIRAELQKRKNLGILPDRKLFRRIQACSIQIYLQDWNFLERQGRVESYADGMVYVLPTLDSYYDSQMGFLPTKNYDPNQTLYNC